MESGVYKDIELDILIDTLDSWKSRPGSPYSLVEVRDSREPAGSACSSAPRTRNRRSTYTPSWWAATTGARARRTSSWSFLRRRSWPPSGRPCSA
ncbi:MAG: hypothetical protein MZV70_22120 [Desulfobacterales bacterium]|nr:hypothetical protein [Desulfobacterales bacterium]